MEGIKFYRFFSVEEHYILKFYTSEDCSFFRRQFFQSPENVKILNEKKNKISRTLNVNFSQCFRKFPGLP